jgi:hypothetical protein
MKRSLFAAALLTFAWGVASADSSAPTTCKDGTTSSATGRGACSSHGGVQNSASSPSAASAPAKAGADTSQPAATPATPSADAKPAAATAKPAAAKSSGNTDPTGATAKCKDGTYSKSKSHSGACSHHGGVDQWMDAASK